MWKQLSKTEWPKDGAYHWVRGRGNTWIAMFEKEWMLLPGTSLRSKTKNDCDIDEWEYYTLPITQEIVPEVQEQWFI